MRSKLFVPGSRPELFQKALSSQADALSFDLEDAVTEERKSEARMHVQQFIEKLSASTKTIIVRTNHTSSRHFADDLAAISRNGLSIVNLPKVESVEEIQETANLLERYEKEFAVQQPIGILVNIESPKGLRLAADLAIAHPKIIGLQIGYGDLFSPLEIDRSNLSAIQQVMFSVRMAAGAANILAIDGAFTNVADVAGFFAEAELAKKFGYIGKSCVHPRQIELANKVFRPSDLDIQHSIKVLNMLNDPLYTGVGAFVVDGKMVDAPLFERARKIVEQAKSLQLLTT